MKCGYEIAKRVIKDKQNNNNLCVMGAQIEEE